MALRWPSIGLVAAILAITACEGTERTVAEASDMRTIEETTAEPTPEVTESPTARTMPTAIERAEDLTIEIQPKIERTDWDDAENKAEELRQLSTSLAQTDAPTAEVAAFDSAVNTLAANITNRDKIAAGLAAGDAQRAALAMAAAYSPEVPVAVGYMEVATWDLTYHSEAGDWSEAANDLEELEKQYGKVQAHLTQRDRDLAKKVEEEIEKLRTAIAEEDEHEAKKKAKEIRDHLHKIAKTYEDRRNER